LIVICAECATQFQLDEARVPESGIRVRCSVCKHAFFVEHPDAAGAAFADPIARAVQEALDAEAGEVPEAPHDLEAAGAPAAAAAGSADEARDDESWEFSDGGRLSEAVTRDSGDAFEESFEAAREAVDELLGAPEPDRGGAPFPAPVMEEGPPQEPAPAVEVGPVDADAAPPLADDPWEVPAWSEGESGLDEADAGVASSAAFTGDDLEIETHEERPEDPELDPFADDLAGPPAFGDLGEPGGLELGGAGGLELDEPGDLDLADAPEPPGAGSLAGPAHSASLAAEPLPLGLGAGLELEPGSVVPAWLAGAGRGLGWGVVTILAAVVFWASVAPRTAPGVRARSQPLAGFEATAIEGRWVENAIAGPLYVVRGELYNPGPEPRTPGARLAVRLLDADGSPLDEALASLAPPLEVAWLREVHPREVRALREAGAQELARTPVVPGGRIAFEAVVETLPEEARRFDLVVAAPGAARPEGS